MIKFFRRIRQQLLSENKFSKYLIYAIGEIFLVVLGILIAVQLNNWNESKKLKLVEIDILEGIRTDILKDTIDINANIRAYTQFQKVDSFALDHLIHKKELEKSLIQALNSIVIADWNITIHDSHFQEAKQKGLSVISNPTLRESLSRLYEFHYEHLDFVENYWENLDHNKLLKKEVAQYIGYDSTGLIISKDSYDRLLSDTNTIYYITLGKQMKDRLLKIHVNKLKTILEVIDDIDNELMSLKE